jgi:hypothetical protein
MCRAHAELTIEGEVRSAFLVERKQMKLSRLWLALFIAAAPLLGGAGQANAAADWINFSNDVVVPACPGFAVRIQTEGRVKIEFGPVLTLKQSSTHATYTDVVTGNSVKLSDNANSSAALNGDGTANVTAQGSINLGGPAIGLVRVNGRVNFVFNGNLGFVDSYEVVAGHTTDICTLID